MLGTRIDLNTFPQSIDVPNSDSGADYLVHGFGGPRSAPTRRQAPYKFKKLDGGGFVGGVSILRTLKTVKQCIFYRQAAQVLVNARR